MPAPSLSRRRLLATLGSIVTLPGAGLVSDALAQDKPTTSDGGPFVPTPWIILDEMLKLAEIGNTDTVYDLGSGDGRLVIEAVKRYGARGVGVERDANLVNFARRQAQTDNIAERASFSAGDLFETDLRGATVVTMYLLPRIMPRLVPKLRAELPAGARIVSHDYPLAPWKADKTLNFDVEEKLMINGTVTTNLYFYLVPARINGRWIVEVPAWAGNAPLQISIEQAPDKLEGMLLVESGDVLLRDFSLRADKIRFSLFYGGRMIDFAGTVTGKTGGDTMSGNVKSRGDSGSWSARRRA